MKSDPQQTQSDMQYVTILKSIQEQLTIPSFMYEQMLSILTNYKQLKSKCQQQQKLNKLKDRLLQNVTNLFQTKQAKILNRLQALQEINVKYIQRYIEAKNKKNGKSTKGNLNMSLQIESKINGSCHNAQGRQKFDESLQKQERQVSMKSQEDLFSQNAKILYTHSVFQSNEWMNLIKESENKINEIRSGQIQKNKEASHNQSNQRALAKVMLQSIERYCYSTDYQSDFYNQGQIKTNLFIKQVEELIRLKKKQIEDNTFLRKNIELNYDLKRLKEFLERVNKFQRKVNRLKSLVISQNNQSNVHTQIFELLSDKVQIENLIEAEIESFYSIGEGALPENTYNLNKLSIKQSTQRQKLIFDRLCRSILLSIQPENQCQFILKLEKKLNQNQDSTQLTIKTKLKSLQSIVSKLQTESKKDKNLISNLKKENEKIVKDLKQIQRMKDKFEFNLSEQQSKRKEGFFKIKEEVSQKSQKSKTLSKVDKLIAREQQDQQKQLLRQCLYRKDELYEMQKQQLAESKQNLIKIEHKIKTYFEQQGISSNFDTSYVNFQELFENYSKIVTKNAYERYPEERTQMAKIIQTKYQKLVQQQKQQFEERIEDFKEEIKHIELQRDSYKNSMNAQQKQFNKLKQFTEKIVVKKADLQMQNSKIQEILKSVLDIMFAYLMSNISYENLLEQVQSTIENIKTCLKYRQREKEKESKESPLMDYRFSGLSAVSNDYSFSKLNKESYCDYFNEDSQAEQESEVISKISSEDEVLPPSRPSYSTNNAPKRHMAMMDINQRATMAHEDQSLLGYLNPIQIRTPRVQYQRNTVLIDGLHDDNIRTLESNLGYLRNRIPQQTIEVQRDLELDAKEMYIKYKQALKCLEEAEKINQENEVHYQNFLKQLKEEGAFEAQQKIESKLFYMEKTIKEQQKLIEQQRIEFETTIAKQVMESEKTMTQLIRNLNRSMSSSREMK